MHPRYKREFYQKKPEEKSGPLTRSDKILTGAEWSTLIVGKLSPWIQVDSTEKMIRKNSEKVKWCLSLSLLPLPVLEVFLPPSSWRGGRDCFGRGSCFDSACYLPWGGRGGGGGGGGGGT